MSEISHAIYDEYRKLQVAKRGEEEITDAVVDRVESLIRGRIEAGLQELREDAYLLNSRLKAGELDEDERHECHGKLLHMAGMIGDFAKSLDLPVDAKGWTI